MRAGVKDILLAAAIAVVVLLHGAWLARITPFNMGDEGYLYYIAWRVQQGARLFEDIELFTYAPGLFQLWGEWFDLFGPTVASGRALGVLLAALNVALSYGVARALGLRKRHASSRSAPELSQARLRRFGGADRSHTRMAGRGACLLASGGSGGVVGTASRLRRLCAKPDRKS